MGGCCISEACSMHIAASHWSVTGGLGLLQEYYRQYICSDGLVPNMR